MSGSLSSSLPTKTLYTPLLSPIQNNDPNMYEPGLLSKYINLVQTERPGARNLYPHVQTDSGAYTVSLTLDTRNSFYAGEYF